MLCNCASHSHVTHIGPEDKPIVGGGGGQPSETTLPAFFTYLVLDYLKHSYLIVVVVSVLTCPLTLNPIAL